MVVSVSCVSHRNPLNWRRARYLEARKVSLRCVRQGRVLQGSTTAALQNSSSAGTAA